VTSHMRPACERGRSPVGEDKMAASVGQPCLRLLRGVAPWRSRYNNAARLLLSRVRPGPHGLQDKGVTSLSRACPEEGSRGGGATFTLSSGAGVTCSRVGLSRFS
jgi:hypothetical protein